MLVIVFLIFLKLVQARKQPIPERNNSITIIKNFAEALLYHLSDDLWPGLNTIEELDPATSWVGKWGVALAADNWGVGV